jgi:hypothetical protein
MKSKDALMFGAAVLLVAAGCAYSAPYKTSGESFSNQGVEVGITGVRCYVNRTADPMTETTIDDELDIPAAQAVAPRRSKVIDVLPGETKQVRLAYMPAGAADCRRNFELELANSVEVSGFPATLSPIEFEAER